MTIQQQPTVEDRRSAIEALLASALTMGDLSLIRSLLAIRAAQAGVLEDLKVTA